jgi:hypothetical protein
MPGWFDFSAAIAFFRTLLPPDDLSAFLPRPPAGSTRPPVTFEDYSTRTLHFWRMVHVLLTFVAYGERRRAQKHRANGWAPALREPPALASLERPSLYATCAAIAKDTFSKLLGDELDLLVRLAARTRRALLAHETNADAWQAALEQQMLRTWGMLENTLAVWTEEECLEAEREGWQACWRRMFGTRPPKTLLPAEPVVLRQPAARRGA